MPDLLSFPKDRYLQAAIDRYFNSAQQKKLLIDDFGKKVADSLGMPNLYLQGTFDSLCAGSNDVFDLGVFERKLTIAVDGQYLESRDEILIAFNSAYQAYIDAQEAYEKYKYEFEKYFGCSLDKLRGDWVNIRINKGKRIFVEDLERSIK